MSKARVTWAFNDVVSSAQLNQMVTDDIVRAQLIWNSAGTCVPVAGFFNQDIGAFLLQFLPDPRIKLLFPRFPETSIVGNTDNVEAALV